jgi:hypothetical protein
MEQCFMLATQIISGGLGPQFPVWWRNGSHLCVDIAVRLRASHQNREQ